MPAFEEEHMPLKIMPHGRLQEWVAEEKGFFIAEGLDYTFPLNSGDYGIHSVQRDEGGEVEYTRENFEATRRWTEAHDLFSGPPSAGYDQAALV